MFVSTSIPVHVGVDEFTFIASTKEHSPISRI
jgi:hypothetical protein